MVISISKNVRIVTADERNWVVERLKVSSSKGRGAHFAKPGTERWVFIGYFSRLLPAVERAVDLHLLLTEETTDLRGLRDLLRATVAKIVASAEAQKVA